MRHSLAPGKEEQVAETHYYAQFSLQCGVARHSRRIQRLNHGRQTATGGTDIWCAHNSKGALIALNGARADDTSAGAVPTYSLPAPISRLGGPHVMIIHALSRTTPTLIQCDRDPPAGCSPFQHSPALSVRPSICPSVDPSTSLTSAPHSSLYRILSRSDPSLSAH